MTELFLQRLEFRGAPANVGIAALTEVPTCHPPLPAPPLSWDMRYADAAALLSNDPFALWFMTGDELPPIEVVDYVFRMRALGYTADSALDFDSLTGEMSV